MKKLLQQIFSSLVVLFMPLLALAQPIDPSFDTGAGTNLRGAIEAVIRGALWIVGIIAIVFIVIGGFRYVVSQGDEGATKTARNTILYAVIGLALVFLAGAIVSFVFDVLV